MNVNLNSVRNDIEWGFVNMPEEASLCEEGVRNAVIDPVKNAFKYAWDGALKLEDDSEEEGEESKVKNPGVTGKESKAAKKARKKKEKAAAKTSGEKKVAEVKSEEGESEVKKVKSKKTEKKSKKAEKALDPEKETKKAEKKKEKALEEDTIEVVQVASAVEEGLIIANDIPLIAEEKPKVKKDKKGSREEFGLKHYAVLTAAVSFTTGMAILFRESPFLAFAFTGAWMDFIRVAYKSLPQKGWQINSFRVAAVASAIITVISANFTPKDSIWNAIPFFNFAVGVLVKGEFGKNIDPTKILDIQAYNIGERLTNAGLTADKINTGFTAALIGSSIPLTMPTLTSAIQVTGSTVLKMNLRKGVNSYLKNITSIEDPKCKKIALIGTFSLFGLVGGLSYLALEKKLSENAMLIAGITALNIVPFDTFARICKNGLWRFAKQLKIEYTGLSQEKEKSSNDIKENLLKLAKRSPLGFLLLGIVLGVSYPLNEYFISRNIPVGLSVVVAQEMATLLKPISKEWVGTTESLVFELPALAALSLGVVKNDFALAMLVDNTVFCLKDKVRPKKLEA